MLTSISIILIFGLLAGVIFSKFKSPSLIGYVLVGIIISPYAFNLIDESILNISSDIRQIALVIILTRAGLSLNIKDLIKVGRPAILMCFVPATIEIFGTMLLAPMLLNVSILEAALMGSVLAAVSPAVVVPRMIKLIEEGYGTNKSIPQLILAGTSVDDVFVIVVFTSLTSLLTTGNLSITSFINVPISILLGILLGILTGLGLIVFYKKFHIRDSIKLLLTLSISFILLEIETQLKTILPISGLIAIMVLGMTIKLKYEPLAIRLQSKYNKLWICAEIFLFVLVGVTVNLKYVQSAGVAAICLILCALIFRMIGVFLSLLKTNLNVKERIFSMIAYTPKATVQAAIGTIPLTLGLECGNIICTVAVLSILITAPFGSICIDNLYRKLLIKTQ